MNLLYDGINHNVVIETDLKRKLTIDGRTDSYTVYKVRLDWLFYNDQNDRIATWISQYKAQNNGQSPDMSDHDAYNDIIENFIVESNPEAIKKTQNNIKLVEQREPGVVLSDGRIIDGNRRFTCLRRLAKENDKFNYFETVILPNTIENNAKQIKMLELNIQHGEESKVDYNPVDRLVGIYNDIVDTKLLSEEEYARSTMLSLTEVKRLVDLSKLMVEFLEFANAPGQFYMARDLQITYPLEELQKLMRKCNTEDEKEDMKIAVFTNILLQPVGDMTRFVRNFKSIIGSEHQDKFFEEQKEIAEEVLEIMPEVGKVNTSVIRDQIRNDEELQEKITNSVDAAVFNAKRNETKKRPIVLAEKATGLIEDIDVNIIKKMNDSEHLRLEKQLKLLEEAINIVKENL